MSELFGSERMLLATMMMRPADCWTVVIEPEHFAIESHGEILRVIRDQSEESLPVDPITLMERFEREGRKELVQLVGDITNNAPTAVPDVVGHSIVAAWRRRKAKDIGASLMAANDDSAVDTAISSLMALHAVEQNHEFDAKSAARAAFAELQRIHEAGGKLPGITTGLLDLDEKLGGFHPGDLVVIGGRAAMGKTSALIGMARAAAKAGNPVGMISGEQPVEQVSTRLIAASAKVDAKKFRTAKFEDDEWNRVYAGTSEIASLPIWFLDRSSPSLAEVYRVARRWKHKHNIMALYVDYLQRIQGDGERRYEQVSMVTRGLKNLARDLGIPIVALAQVGRGVEGRADKRPRMSDLSDSGEIEKEADQVFLIYREGYYDEKKPQSEAEIIVDKNRHGATGTIKVAWKGETMTFGNLSTDNPWN